jgi:hypothetical protein
LSIIRDVHCPTKNLTQRLALPTPVKESWLNSLLTELALALVHKSLYLILLRHDLLGLIVFEGRQATIEAHPISPHLSRLYGKEFHQVS